MTPSLEIFAATPSGPAPLPLPPGVTELNDAFDGFPLGIYEGLRTLDRERLVALPEHLDRAERSIARLGWSFQLDHRTLCDCLAATLATTTADSRVRFDVLQEFIDSPLGKTRLLFGLAPLVLPSAEAYRRGVGVLLLRELERADPLIKHASFVVERRSFPLGGKDAFERLLVDRDERVLECTASSFFGIRGGTIVTAGEDVLEGVTAQRVARLADEGQHPFDAGGMTVDELGTLDEAFLTSSIKGLVPVVRIDERSVGDGKVGPLTGELMRGYESWMQREARTATEVARALAD